MKPAWILSAAVLLLAACGKPHLSPENSELYHRLAERPVYCTSEKDCTKKWARAVEWVRAHSTLTHGDGKTWSYPIARLTDSTVQTDGYRGGSGRSQGSEPIFRIIKFPREDGSFGFEYYSACEEVISCTPSAEFLRISFVSTIMGFPEGVREESGRFDIDLNKFPLASHPR